jgi:hypothetical protein
MSSGETQVSRIFGDPSAWKGLPNCISLEISGMVVSNDEFQVDSLRMGLERLEAFQ